jgi:hypothetical protein
MPVPAFKPGAKNFTAMNKSRFQVLLFLFGLLAGSGIKSVGQDTTLYFKTDSLFSRVPGTFSSIRLGDFPDFYLDHSPEGKDRRCFKKYKYLINQLPTQKNHELYYNLARSLWELKKTTAAEKMFLTIIRSKGSFYSDSYYHSSDIPGDKTKNIYGYGSYTSNYKNYAAVFLSKIYIEKKQFARALHYLDEAVKKYKAIYTCGTGYNMQHDEYNALYAYCYEGLHWHKKLMNLLLPDCLWANAEKINGAIKALYSQNEIEKELERAAASIKCTLNNYPSYSYISTIHDDNSETHDTISYYSGSARIRLFNKQIDMPVPDLKNGEHLKKEQFLQLFKESHFYTRLLNKS